MNWWECCAGLCVMTGTILGSSVLLGILGVGPPVLIVAVVLVCLVAFGGFCAADAVLTRARR